MRVAAAGRVARRGVMIVAVFIALAGLWELYRLVWTSAQSNWPFEVNSSSMPHVFAALKIAATAGVVGYKPMVVKLTLGGK